ncbi:MAG: tRNA 2-thiouridine(34) synthase MnmA [candidate division WOR-3 bacterium]
MTKRVLVALSGGVDSAVAAFLLKEMGYQVIGIHFNVIPQSKYFHNLKKNENDLKSICEKLDIPLQIIDLQTEFQSQIIDNFCAEYIAGRTPNPCVLCNRIIKFKSLLEYAIKYDAQKIATGHYAIIDYDKSKNQWLLRQAVDKQKDQSYVLYKLNQEILTKTYLPLGKLTKSEVRSIAQKLHLTVADKPDSQEVCFIPDRNYIKFITSAQSYQPQTGNIINLQGKVIGKHPGIIYYTIGQRKRIGIASKKPYYVVKIDVKNNQIIVGEEKDVYQKRFQVKDLNYINFKRLTKTINAQVKIRYTHQPALALIKPINDRVEVEFQEAQWAITPGQAAVFYDHDIVIGGGTIEYVL